MDSPIEFTPNFAHRPAELSRENNEEVANRVRNAIETIQANEYGFEDEEIKARLDAQQDITSLGRITLPYLRDILTNNSSNSTGYFEYSLYLSALAENEDVDLVLEMLKRPIVYQGRDTSTINQLAEILTRLSFQIRTNNFSQRDDLDKISKEVIQVLENSNGNSFQRDSLYIALAATGTSRALDYITTNAQRNQNYPQLTDILIDQDNISIFARDRWEFHTWDDILEHRSYYSRGNESSLVDIGDDIPSMYFKTREEDEIIYRDKDISTAAILDEGSVLIDSIMRKTLEAARKIPDIGESKTLLHLHLFNYIRSRPHVSSEDCHNELVRFAETVNEEKEYSMDRSMPTVGVEVEVSGEVFPHHMHDKPIILALKKMGLKIKQEYRSTEIEFPPSFSARTQARMILELQEMGLIPKDPSIFASLHATLGVDANALAGGKERDFITNLSDLLSYAYVPAGRIKTRGSSYESFKVKESAHEVQPIKKSIRDTTLVEFRTPRVLWNKTFRILTDIQRIGSLLESNDPVTILLRNEFVKETDELLEKYDLSSNAPALNPKKASEAIKNAWEIKQQATIKRKVDPHHNTPENLIDEARDLMTKYARKVSKLKNEDPRNLMLPGFESIRAHGISTSEEFEKHLKPSDVEYVLDSWDLLSNRVEEDLVRDDIVPTISKEARDVFQESDLDNRQYNEADKDQLIGRHVVVKRIALSGLKESVMVKRTSGFSPVYYLEYQPSGWPSPWTDHSIHQKSTPEEKMKSDHREVRLSRIHTGSSIKGEESETVFHFSNEEESEIKLDQVLHEEALKIRTHVDKTVDFAVQGYAAAVETDSIRSAVYTTFQLGSWDMKNLTIGGYFLDGQLKGLVLNSDDQYNLAFTRASYQEQPSRVFENFITIEPSFLGLRPSTRQYEELSEKGVKVTLIRNTGKTITVEVRDTTNPDASPILMSLPLVVDDIDYLDSIRKQKSLSKPLDAAYQTSFNENLEIETVSRIDSIHFDPEVDIDLNSSLYNLVSTYGDKLQEIILVGGLARGQKRLGGDIDLVAILDDDAMLDSNPEGFTQKKQKNPEMTSFQRQALSSAIKGVDLHLVKRGIFENPQEGTQFDFFMQASKKTMISLWQRKHTDNE